MLKEFGFDIIFKPMDSGVIWSYLNSPKYMIGCSFLGGAGTYAHPFEVYNNIYSSKRLNFESTLDTEDKFLVSPVSGQTYNITQMLGELFSATSTKDIQRLTNDFMQLTNELCIFMPVVEKTAPLRIYDIMLSLPEATSSQIQYSFYYYGTMNQMLAKMMRNKNIYFIE
ncbi:MAG: hypothetical protein ATN36_00105 [Epulopiscium sp. Nele67-Bin005]|nr:MAG: hypothetical protein ATN36_00105 [Epulopiscium sp. Nele67-Bin005]